MFGSQLVIRQCYKDLWRNITSNPHRRIVIMGSPGIGKSWFLFFCMYMLAKAGQSFVYVSYRAGLATANYYMYTRDGVQESDYRTPEMRQLRSEEHTSELQSLMRISYAVYCLYKKK